MQQSPPSPPQMSAKRALDRPAGESDERSPKRQKTAQHYACDATALVLSDGYTDRQKSFLLRNGVTYAALIAVAIWLSPKKRLCLQQLYDFVGAHKNLVPTSNMPNWRNSVRHNLSLRPCFLKIPRYSSAGKKLAGYWGLDKTCLPIAADQLLKAVIAGEISLIPDSPNVKRTWERDWDDDGCEGSSSQDGGSEEAVMVDSWPRTPEQTPERAEGEAATSRRRARSARSCQRVDYLALVKQDDEYYASEDDEDDEDAEDAEQRKPPTTLSPPPEPLLIPFGSAMPQPHHFMMPPQLLPMHPAMQHPFQPMFSACMPPPLLAWPPSAPPPLTQTWMALVAAAHHAAQ